MIYPPTPRCKGERGKGSCTFKFEESSFPGWVGSDCRAEHWICYTPFTTCWDMVFPRKIPTTTPKKCLEQIVHQKISEEKSLPQKTRDISTKNFSQAKFLPKIPRRGSLYQKISEETFFTKKCLKRNPYQTYLPNISAKEKTIYIYEETEETFSTILLKSISTKRDMKRNPYQKN